MLRGFCGDITERKDSRHAIKDINNEETVVRSGSLCAAVYLLGPGTTGAEV
tara:strand:- start:29 stop:181 length:153 start_codon:yes stop_codon:yes gene_type:complete